MAHFKESRAYRQIAAYCEEHPEENMHTAINRFLVNCERNTVFLPTSGVASKFFWDDTPEGRDYWKKFHNTNVR